MGETVKGGSAVIRGEGFNEGVSAEFYGLHKDEPSLPRRSPLLFRISHDGYLAGILTSHAQRYDTISGDRGEIEKDRGS